MRSFAAVVLVSLVFFRSAHADNIAPLVSGQPAGVKKAQMENNNALLIVTGIGLAGLGIGLAASSNGGGPTAFTTAPVATSGTSP